MSAPDPAEAAADSSSKHRAKHRFRSPKLWITSGIAVVVLIGIGVGSFFLFGGQKRTFAGRTTTAQAVVGTQTASVSLDGTLSPRKQSNLNFAVSGEVTKVYVKVGQKVTKGQKLATIDSTTLSDAVDVAAANLASAQASYSDSSSGSSAARRAAAAQVDSAAAALSSAKQDLKSATLTATMTGTVASLDLNVGDQVSGEGSSSGSASQSGTGSSMTGSSSSSGSTSSSSAQVVLISTATWKLDGTVGASDLASLKTGQSASITANSATLTGTVASVGIVATSTSDGAATFPVVINLSGTHNDLYSGTTASAVITTGSYANVLTIPTAAISTANGKTVVTKVGSNSTTTVTEVTTGRVFGDATEITSGLSQGDTVQIVLRPSSTSTSSNSTSGGFGFGGGGGLGGGMDAGGPPAGGGAGGAPGR